MEGREPPPRDEEAHDVLAAEAFAVPTADPALRHRPITLPDDPTGIAEPHDILAAEEFAIPAPRPAASPGSAASRIGAKVPAPVRLGAALATVLIVLRMLRRRRRG